MLDRIDPADAPGWLAYLNLEEEREFERWDFFCAELLAALANIRRPNRTEPFTATDFRHRPAEDRPRKPVQRQTVAEADALLMSLVSKPRPKPKPTTKPKRK